MLTVLKSSDKEAVKTRLLERGRGDFSSEQAVVDAIIRDIRTDGDAALFAAIRKFDGFDVNKTNILVAESEIEDAYRAVDQDLLAVMKRAAKNIFAFHKRQIRSDWFMEEGGRVVGQVYRPVEYAGVYVPGGKAAYPSSVLMNIVPAKCAGVPNIYVATPAQNGAVNPATLVAAREAGADRIYKMGGAQAVAAFALGTRTIPKVDVVAGPGNIFVALAKKSLFGTVGVDMIAGPSEILIIADDGANPAFIAADFLSQAEHDEMAACVLVTPSRKIASEVEKEIVRQASYLPKRDIVQKSIDRYGTIILAADLDDAIRTANEISPEHLEILTEDPKDVLKKIKNAGSIFLGEYSPEPLGDYYAGPNHVLPTNGTARFSSPLNVDHFQKKSGVIYYSKEEFEKVYRDVEQFAQKEGLEAHARAASIRFKEDKNEDK
jgi:histidinol dehydrogenase